MTVRQLIEKIQHLESDEEVLIASDEEGNMYGKCEWVDRDGGYVILYPGETVEIPIDEEEYLKLKAKYDSMH